MKELRQLEIADCFTVNLSDLDGNKFFPPGSPTSCYAGSWTKKYGYPDNQVAFVKERLIEQGIQKGDPVYLYTGQDHPYERILKPVVIAARELGARPILLSCRCRCYEDQKKELAVNLKIPLRFIG